MSSDRPAAPSHPPVDPLVGKVLAGKFKIASLIARGGMGRVYKAEQVPLGRVCAVKILAVPAEVEGDEFRKRFFLEASIGARLTHPNTVTIFDYGQSEEGAYFIAMEYLEGKMLSRVIKDEGPFPEERAAHIARQICRSLREAHALGVVHRDLKPGNVYLIGHGDETDMVKVLDFGLVKNIEPDGAEDLTQAGAFMGSPKYMAPEQIKGEHCDGRTDVYALGVILFEMLTGKVPYERAKQLDTLVAHLNDPVPRIRDKNPNVEVSPNIEAIVLRCMAKNPADRFGGMDEVLAALKMSSGQAALTGTRTSEIAITPAQGVPTGAYPAASVTPPPSALPSHTGEHSIAHSMTPPSHAPARRRAWIPIALGAVIASAAVAVVAVRSRNDAPKQQASAPSTVEAPPATTTMNAPPPPPPPPTTAAAPTVEPAFVEIDSDPRGAKVRDASQVVLCDKTPCKVQVDGKSMLLIVDAEGYADAKIKIAPGDAPRMVKLQKSAAWHPPPAAKPAATTTATATAAPPPTVFKPDPYGGPY